MPNQSARANSRQIPLLLRQAIPDFEESGKAVPICVTNRYTIRLNPQAGVYSAIKLFECLLDNVRIHDHMDLPTCSRCSQMLASAVDLYRGDFLANFYLDDSNEFEEWAETNRQNYRQKVLDALEILTSLAVFKKVYSETRAYGEKQLEIDNLCENAYRQLMEVWALSGHRVDALALYKNCLWFFAEELSMTPSVRTTELYEKFVLAILILINLRMGDACP